MSSFYKLLFILTTKITNTRKKNVRESLCFCLCPSVAQKKTRQTTTDIANISALCHNYAMALSEWKYPTYRPRRGSFAAYRRGHQRKIKEKARRAKRFHIQGLDLSGDAEHFRYKITDIPPVVFEVKELKILNLGRNLLTSLPEEIGNLTELRSLNLGSNQLTNLPDSMENLEQLTRLDLHANQFYNLPPVIGKLENLRELYIYDNHLIKIPEWISELKHLAILDLDGNRINKLPDSISKLEELVSLNVGNNKLFNLPKSLGELKNLSFFYFDHNRFLSVPEQVYELNSLKLLWMNENRIQNISEDIGNLNELKVLRLDNNPLKHEPPPELIAKGADTIKDYYVKGRQEPVQRVFHAMVPGERDEGENVNGQTTEPTRNIKGLERVRRAAIMKQTPEQDTELPTETTPHSPTPAIEKVTDKKVFISYSAGDESDLLVDRLEKELEKQGANVIRSGHNLMYPASLSKFMGEGNDSKSENDSENKSENKVIIAILSQGFLYSDICMLDLATLSENAEFKDRFFPVVMNDVQLGDTFEFDHKLNFWNKKIIELYRAMREVSSRERGVLQEEIRRYQSIRLKLSEVSENVKRLDVKKEGELKDKLGLRGFVGKVLGAV